MAKYVGRSKQRFYAKKTAAKIMVSCFLVIVACGTLLCYGRQHRCQCSHCRREYGTDEIKNNEPRGNKATPYNPAVLVNYSEPDEMEEK